MKFRLPRWLRSTNVLAIITAVLMVAARGQAEPLPLERAIRLALAHSTGSAIANADVQRALASYRELRNNYLPQLFVGSGLGWTYGYPLSIEGSAPALADAVAQSSIFNPAQRQFMNAAKTDWRASVFQDKDQRNAVIQDVALTYAELAKWEARLVRLQQDESLAQQMEQAVAERVQEGVDSSVDLNKAKLVAARMRLHRAEAHGSADVLRQHLSTLTGLLHRTRARNHSGFAARRRGRRTFRKSSRHQSCHQVCRATFAGGSHASFGRAPRFVPVR
jgi:outer membrane protein TolC